MTDEVTGNGLLDELLKQADEGEVLIDPRCGRYESAILSGVQVAASSDGSYRVDIYWSGLADNEGLSFEHTQRVFLPSVTTHPIGKSRFMQLLKSLGVVPATYKNVIYFSGSEGATQLADAMMKACAGNEFPITISQDNRGFYNTTVRQRPRAAASFQ